MMIRISGKHFELGSALRTHIEERVKAASLKFFGERVSGSVVLDHEGSGYRTDCTLHLDSGTTLHVEGFGQEPYASFDLAADRLEARLRRYKRRLKEHHGTNGKSHPMGVSRTLDVAGIEVGEEEPHAFDPVIVAEAQVPLRPLSVSSAVIELDFTGAPVIVFRHATSGRVNVVYRRSDGHVGWVDPETGKEAHT